MKRLLRIELNKILFSRTVWIIFGLHFILLAPSAYGLEEIVKSLMGDKASGSSLGFSIFSFPHAWHNIAYLASWFKLFLAVIVISLVCSEFSSRTLRQNIIDGMSKWEVIWAKEITMLLISLAAVLLLILLTFFLGESSEGVSFFEGAEYLLAYFIGLFFYLNIAYFLSFWLKKPAMTIGILFIYTLIIENILSFQLPESISQYLPMNIIEQMIPNPFASLIGGNVEMGLSMFNFSIVLIYIALMLFLVHLMLQKGHASK